MMLCPFTQYFPQQWHLTVLSGAVLVSLIKSPRERQMVDLSPWGMWTEWREGQKCCPTVTKVFGVRGSGKHLLRPEGTLLCWERPVAVVCAAQLFSMWVGGSLPRMS